MPMVNDVSGYFLNPPRVLEDFTKINEKCELAAVAISYLYHLADSQFLLPELSPDEALYRFGRLAHWMSLNVNSDNKLSLRLSACLAAVFFGLRPSETGVASLHQICIVVH